jgi:hypothetical protein
MSNGLVDKNIAIDYKLDLTFSNVEFLDVAPADILGTIIVSFSRGITPLRLRLAITLKTLRGPFYAVGECTL